MYILGIGKTKFGILNRTLGELAYEAMFKAIKDSGTDISKIQAIYVANFLGGALQNQLHLNSLIASLLPGMNIPIIRVEAACASGGVALHQAILALSRYNPILVVGVEKMSGYDSALLSQRIAAAGEVELDQKNGVIFPASYALVAQEYFHKYQFDNQNLAFLSFKAHHNANLNPLAHFFHKKVSLEEIKSSPLVCSPLRLFDCSPISDGAAAVVLSKEKCSKRDIEILASSLKTDSISLSQRKNITSFTAAKLAAKEAYTQANISPKDINIAEVHDCFTIAEIIALEDLGFCGEGGSKNLIHQKYISLNGPLPINTSGGLKANGHPIGATGISQIYEIVTQLRGEAGERQVKGAKIGLTHNIGGVGGTAVVHILGVPER